MEHQRNHEQSTSDDKFSNDEIQRYSRQLILPQFGVDAQKRLRSARVLIIGCGGLGTPASLYLSGAGVGVLGLADRPGDVVESSNLHRQIAYVSSDVNVLKPNALAQSLRARNPHVQIIRETCDSDGAGVTPQNASTLVSKYDIVLDCTDNVRARYVIGDACARTNTPLVSGAAIGLSGQLSVHAYGSGCYRCTFPAAPPPNCVGSCDASGVLGPVPGVIGTLMAVEAIKMASRFSGAEPFVARLLLYDAAAADAPFRSVKLRPGKRPGCIACATDENAIDLSTYDYDAFLAGKAQGQNANLENGHNEKTQLKNNSSDHYYDKSLSLRMSVQKLNEIRKTFTSHAVRLDENGCSDARSEKSQSYALIDVRPKPEFDICHLDEAVSIPLQTLKDQAVALARNINIFADTRQTILICRRGINSQKARRALVEAGARNVKDVIGGMQEWHESIDNNFPTY